jgi:hypothetical protein
LKILRFIHCDHIITPVTCENLADLAVAAEYFQVETLITYCAQRIAEKVSVEDVMKVLNKVFSGNNLDCVAEACRKVIIIYLFITLNIINQKQIHKQSYLVFTTYHHVLF